MKIIVLIVTTVLLLASQVQAEPTYYNVDLYQNGKHIKHWKAEAQQIKLKTQFDIKFEIPGRTIYIWKEGLIAESIGKIEKPY